MSWDTLGPILDAINGVLWHELVLWSVLGAGLLFTVWTKFGQWRALTHGVAVVRGQFDHRGSPGAVSHFQALSAALSATVGLGNIAGVAVAVEVGGPGAIFWMWVVGLVGMALKTAEVTQSMLYRNVDDPDDPHGGPMWVVYRGIKRRAPGLAKLGWAIGAIFCATLIISAVTGGNMFQAWNVGDVTRTYFGVPEPASGIALAVLVGVAILGGIKRIGAWAGRLVPLMCVFYLLAAIYVLSVHFTEIPALFGLIFSHAFSPTDAQDAFLGGTFGSAVLWGMKRALFSSEAGQGSSPIAHSAARTNEPVREGVVAGLEPFIDTLVVCTLTALVMLASGAWNRGPESTLGSDVKWVQVTEGSWELSQRAAPPRSAEAMRVAGPWVGTESVFALIEVPEEDSRTGSHRRAFRGQLARDDSGNFSIRWQPFVAPNPPKLVSTALFTDYTGASLTAHAFDRVAPGLGKWLIVLASWLFALSTIISWSYYGEQGVVFLVGTRGVFPYRLIYSALVLVATTGWIRTADQLDAVSSLGTGVMLVANLPIMLFFGREAMQAYHDYLRRLDSGEFHRHKGPSFVELAEGGTKDD